MPDAELTCRNCGAPTKPNEVVCDFCSAAVSQEAMQHAVRCPQCKHPVLEGTMQCTQCKYVEQCLFCARVSPIGAQQCVQCNEAFVGMKERKAARDAQLRQQQMIRVGTEVAEVALPLVGSLLSGGSSSNQAQGGGGLLGAVESLIEDVEKS
jgi:hypothetical protein